MGYPQPHSQASSGSPAFNGTQLTLVSPHSKEREDRGPVVSHAAQGQACAIFEGEGRAGGRPHREEAFPDPASPPRAWPILGALQTKGSPDPAAP